MQTVFGANHKTRGFLVVRPRDRSECLSARDETDKIVQVLKAAHSYENNDEQLLPPATQRIVFENAATDDQGNIPASIQHIR